MHNHHYCAIRYCGDHGRKAAAVPIGEVMFIISVMTLALIWLYPSAFDPVLTSLRVIIVLSGHD
jgi:hypothetical protein